MFADIILPLNIGNTYTYGVPIDMQEDICVGTRVEVNLGKSKLYTGVVLHLHNNKPEAFIVKPILNIIDNEPFVSKAMLQFWQWLSTYYACNLGEVMAAVLPNYLKLSSQTMLILNQSFDIDKYKWTNDEFYLIEVLKSKEVLTISEATKVIKAKNAKAVINKLLQKQVLFSYEENKQGYKPKVENFVVLNETLDNEEDLNAVFNNLEKAPKQLHVLLSYLHLASINNMVKQTELLEKSNASSAQLKALIEKGIFTLEQQQQNRIQYTANKEYAAFVLNDAQQNAYKTIINSFEQNKPALLHGVTGSGKTNVHLKIAQHIIATQQVLYLVPEIALTTQLINKLYSFFGDKLVVYHSKFSNHERVETWQQVFNGEAKIILGARSALFLPFNNLGLIIVDEEHESSYKQQDPSPRYNARDAALVLQKLQGCQVLLSSATPSLESYYNALKGKYTLVSLLKRYASLQLPEVKIINSKTNPTIKRLSPVFTNELLEAIDQALTNKSQVLLFQNRRGFAPYLYCSNCGWNAHCNQCDVSLNYHKATDQLHCHYCGTKRAIFKSCPSCSSQKLFYKNYGTERIEDEIKKIYPNAVVDRLDIDTARTKNKYKSIIQKVERNVTDILVGTQMVVKGLDFDNIQLVGVISADSAISQTDFRANEKGYQTLSQVSGRAGRKNGNALVILQAYNQAHPVFEYVQQSAYHQFALQELAQRKLFNFPPYCSLIKIAFKHRNQNTLEQASLQIGAYISTIQHTSMLGPSDPVINKLQNWYIKEIVLKMPKNKSILAYVKSTLKNYFASFLAQKGNSTFQVSIDVDPI